MKSFPLCVTAILLFLFSETHLYGQTGNIKIGDQCPDVVLNMVNYTSHTAKISDFRGKLLILDFWTTWCGPCVHSLPKIDSLQKKFADKVQILPVNYEDEKKVHFFLDKMAQGGHIRIVSVTDDSVLQKCFYHTYIPHCVWIDANGKVIAISDGEQLTASHIQEAVNGQSLSFVQPEILKYMDLTKPLFIPTTSSFDNIGQTNIENVSEEDVLYHSILTGYRKECIIGRMGYGTSTRITVSNISPANLYGKAFENKEIGNGFDPLSFSAPGKTIWEVKDSSLLILDGKYADQVIKGNAVLFKEWLKRYSYCYEIQTPKSWGPDKKYELMLEDLNRYFGSLYGIEGSFEKRKVKCLVLERTSKQNKLTTNGGEQSIQHSPYNFNMVNTPLYLLGEFLSTYYLHKITVDQTGYKGNFDISLNCDLTDLKAINTELARYDLQFVESENEQDIIIIRQTGKNNAHFTPLDQEQ
jgi:thiol-disulfide isomerase/thioredoxin